MQWIKVFTDIFANSKIKILLKERDGDTFFRVWIQLTAARRRGGAAHLRRPREPGVADAGPARADARAPAPRSGALPAQGPVVCALAQGDRRKL